MRRSRALKTACLVALLAGLLCATVEARLYRLWGGQVTVEVPSGFRLRPNGPNAYMVLSLVRGRNPRVATLIITRGLGFSNEPDWSRLVELWRSNLQWGSNLRTIVAPRGIGNAFNVEFVRGTGMSSSRSKLRALHRRRAHEMDFLNMHTITVAAVPASAWGAPETRALLRALHSARVRR